MNPAGTNRTSSETSADSVLLVDDEPALLEIFSAILSPRFEISTAADARAAGVLLRQKSFKVIVSDHTMPGETGLSFLSRARADFPHMQRVLVTGNMTPEMRIRTSDSDLLFAFLEKPVSIDQLMSVVQSAAHVHDTLLAAAK